MKRVNGSFRDPSGLVFADGEHIVRTIGESFRPDWEQGMASGFLPEAVAAGKLVAFAELPPDTGAGAGLLPPTPDVHAHAAVWRTLRVRRLPLITYPYEWCFSQLRDAALLTLDLHERALESGLTLKDASAYNVQFVGRNPLFIDLLSFALRPEDAPWAAYRQFCMHFLAPLAAQAWLGLWCGGLTRLWVEGLPLGHAAALLPWRARLSPGLALHLFAHARMEARHADARRTAGQARAVRQSVKTARNLAQSLRAAIEGLRPPRQATEWGDYYADTNYSETAAASKAEIVARVAGEQPGELALDLGANTGRYSRLLAPHFGLVAAADMDPLAVERHYRALRAEAGAPANILPLVQDLANPSPALGWACAERASFAERCRADCVLALALVHHLVISAGIPLPLVAAHLADLTRPGGRLVLEEVPREDSQVRSLLAVRQDIFADYTPQGLQAAFAPHFLLEASLPVADSARTLHVWRRRGPCPAA